MTAKNSEHAEPGDRADDPATPQDATTGAEGGGGDGGSSDDDTQPDDAGETGTLGDHDVT